MILLAVACQPENNKKSRGSGDPEMDRFISGLMKQMTLEEKLGQLNLPASGDIMTGQTKSTGIAAKIREGKVGGLFNIRTVEKIRKSSASPWKRAG